QISKARQRKRANRFAIVSGEQIAVIILVRKDAEMVLPKINHQLVKLLFAVNRAQEFRALQFSHDHLWIFWRGSWFRGRERRHLACFFLLWTHFTLHRSRWERRHLVCICPIRSDLECRTHSRFLSRHGRYRRRTDSRFRWRVLLD